MFHVWFELAVWNTKGFRFGLKEGLKGGLNHLLNQIQSFRFQQFPSNPQGFRVWFKHPPPETLRGHPLEEPLPPSSKNPSIFDRRSRRTKNPPHLQSSIFGLEDRRTPASSIFGFEDWSGDRTEDGGGGDFFEDGGFFEDSFFLRSYGSEQRTLLSSIFGARRTKNPQSSTVSAGVKSNTFPFFFFFGPAPFRPIFTRSSQRS